MPGRRRNPGRWGRSADCGCGERITEAAEPKLHGCGTDAHGSWSRKGFRCARPRFGRAHRRRARVPPAGSDVAATSVTARRAQRAASWKNSEEFVRPTHRNDSLGLRAHLANPRQARERLEDLQRPRTAARGCAGDAGVLGQNGIDELKELHARPWGRCGQRAPGRHGAASYGRWRVQGPAGAVRTRAGGEPNAAANVRADNALWPHVQGPAARRLVRGR